MHNSCQQLRKVRAVNRPENPFRVIRCGNKLDWRHSSQRERESGICDTCREGHCVQGVDEPMVDGESLPIYSPPIVTMPPIRPRDLFGGL